MTTIHGFFLGGGKVGNLPPPTLPCALPLPPIYFGNLRLPLPLNIFSPLPLYIPYVRCHDAGIRLYRISSTIHFFWYDKNIIT